VLEGSVRATVVVLGGERVQEGLEFGQGGRLRTLRAQPFLEGLLEPLHLAAGGGVVGSAVLLHDPVAVQLGLEPVAAAGAAQAAAGAPGGVHHAVVGQR
jgi:hypothetical protein